MNGASAAGEGGDSHDGRCVKRESERIDPRGAGEQRASCLKPGQLYATHVSSPALQRRVKRDGQVAEMKRESRTWANTCVQRHGGSTRPGQICYTVHRAQSCSTASTVAMQVPAYHQRSLLAGSRASGAHAHVSSISMSRRHVWSCMEPACRYSQHFHSAICGSKGKWGDCQVPMQLALAAHQHL